MYLEFSVIVTIGLLITVILSWRVFSKEQEKY